MRRIVRDAADQIERVVSAAQGGVQLTGYARGLAFEIGAEARLFRRAGGRRARTPRVHRYDRPTAPGTTTAPARRRVVGDRLRVEDS